MIWPQPFNVRMSPARAGQLLDVVSLCSNEERTISDFPEYEHNLNGDQRKALNAIAREIVRSHDTNAAISGVAVIGHADVALREPQHLRAAKELKISEDRASTAEDLLLKAIRAVPGGARIAGMLNTKAIAKGSSERKFIPATNESEMKKNRRVVFRWARCLMEGPIIHPPVIFPPLPAPNPGDDPNTVFAGEHFRFKVLSGFSMGEVGGVFSYTDRGLGCRQRPGGDLRIYGRDGYGRRRSDQRVGRGRLDRRHHDNEARASRSVLGACRS